MAHHRGMEHRSGRTSRWSFEPTLAVLDAVAVAVAYAAAVLLRFDGDVPPQVWGGMLRFLPIAVALHLVSNAQQGSYRQVWAQAGSTEARRLTIATANAGLLAAVVSVGFPGRADLPLSAPIVAAVLVLFLLGAVRFRGRLLLRTRHTTPGGRTTRVVVIGSLETARTVIGQMRDDPGRGLMPVAVVSASPRHWGRTVSGVPVVGPLAMLPTAVAVHGADEALLAFADVDGAGVRRATDKCREVGIPVKVLPTVVGIVGSRPTLRDIRDVSIDDLLGRPQVRTDLAAIARLLAGKRVLITGAGGSIGSEIARQVVSFGPARLVLLDHDETHLHDTCAAIGPEGVPVLADIRDGEVVERLFAAERPEVVFHAAAHKHVPILETFPVEAARTNVLATDGLLRAAARHDVGRFVLISTDKAVHPTSVMGASKRVGEQLMLRRAAGGRACAVRFGNVLGSRGSVIPTFLRQIQAGGPVTVTDPAMQRYFMSTQEAVQLVLQAAVLADGGDIFVLDMGRPVRIVDLAERLILLSGATPGRDVAIEFVGIRPGEKLEEELIGSREDERDTTHPKIRRVTTPVLAHTDLDRGMALLRDHVGRHDQEGTAAVLRGLASEGVAASLTVPDVDGPSAPAPQRQPA